LTPENPITDVAGSRVSKFGKSLRCSALLAGDCAGLLEDGDLAVRTVNLDLVPVGDDLRGDPGSNDSRDAVFRTR
jgi:hypothetical protein